MINRSSYDLCLENLPIKKKGKSQTVIVPMLLVYAHILTSYNTHILRIKQRQVSYDMYNSGTIGQIFVFLNPK